MLKNNIWMPLIRFSLPEHKINMTAGFKNNIEYLNERNE